MFHVVISYLFVSCSGSIASVKEERESYFVCYRLLVMVWLCWERFPLLLVLGIGCVFYCGTPWAFHVIILQGYVFVLLIFTLKHKLWALVIPTFHWTAFPLRSWRSRSFPKIIPNRSRGVDSHTIWGLHVPSTVSLRFYYASVTLLPRCSRFGCVVIALLLRSRYDNEDPATLSLCLWRCSYALATTSATELRFRCAFVSFLYKIGGGLTGFMFI